MRDAAVLLAAATALEMTGRVAQLAAEGARVTGHTEGMRTVDHAIPPQYAYPGKQVADSDNYCYNLQTQLQGVSTFGQHQAVDDCAESLAEADCVTTYVKRYFSPDNYPGLEQGGLIFSECHFTGGACAIDESPVAQHNCTWTHLMEDLISKQGTYTDYCYGEILETRRTLDGLTSAVHDTYDAIMVQNQLISARNQTIRGLLEDQQDLWSTYLDDQENCTSRYNERISTDAQRLQDELDELQSIARPDVRSAVNYNRGEGYQEGAQEGYTAGGRLSSLVETGHTSSMESEACKAFRALVSRVEQHKRVELVSTPRGCEENRTNLQSEFSYVYRRIAEMYDNLTQQIAVERSECYNNATYRYKVAVEGPGGIDEQIQLAAEGIHAAQLQIARLEPEFHDVEHAHTRMNLYWEQLKTTCDRDDDVDESLKLVRRLIQELQECPGRNDFVIQVPHWSPANVVSPAPTPWSEGQAYQAAHPRT